MPSSFSRSISRAGPSSATAGPATARDRGLPSRARRPSHSSRGTSRLNRIGKISLLRRPSSRARSSLVSGGRPCRSANTANASACRCMLSTMVPSMSKMTARGAKRSGTTDYMLRCAGRGTSIIPSIRMSACRALPLEHRTVHRFRPDAAGQRLPHARSIRRRVFLQPERGVLPALHVGAAGRAAAARADVQRTLSVLLRQLARMQSHFAAMAAGGDRGAADRRSVRGRDRQQRRNAAGHARGSRDQPSRDRAVGQRRAGGDARAASTRRRGFRCGPGTATSWPSTATRMR